MQLSRPIFYFLGAVWSRWRSLGLGYWLRVTKHFFGVISDELWWMLTWAKPCWITLYDHSIALLSILLLVDSISLVIELFLDRTQMLLDSFCLVLGCMEMLQDWIASKYRLVLRLVLEGWGMLTSFMNGFTEWVDSVHSEMFLLKVVLWLVRLALLLGLHIKSFGLPAHLRSTLCGFLLELDYFDVWLLLVINRRRFCSDRHALAVFDRLCKSLPITDFMHRLFAWFKFRLLIKWGRCHNWFTWFVIAILCSQIEWLLRLSARSVVIRCRSLEVAI